MMGRILRKASILSVIICMHECCSVGICGKVTWYSLQKRAFDRVVQGSLSVIAFKNIQLMHISKSTHSSSSTPCRQVV